MVNVLDCDITVIKFELQSRYSVDFLTNTLWEMCEPFYSPSYGSDSPTIVLPQGSFDIKRLTKVDMLLNKETKQI